MIVLQMQIINKELDGMHYAIPCNNTKTTIAQENNNKQDTRQANVIEEGLTLNHIHTSLAIPKASQTERHTYLG